MWGIGGWVGGLVLLCVFVSVRVCACVCVSLCGWVQIFGLIFSWKLNHLFYLKSSSVSLYFRRVFYIFRVNSLMTGILWQSFSCENRCQKILLNVYGWYWPAELVIDTQNCFYSSNTYNFLMFSKKTLHMTPQRYTQIVTCKLARSVYLLFVFHKLMHCKYNKIAKRRYYSKKQIWRELGNPSSQKCPNFNREFILFCALCITNLLDLWISFLHAT